MRVRMYEHKAVMDAGRERTFSPGVEYDLPHGLAAPWVAAGCAVAVVAAVTHDAAHGATPAPSAPRLSTGGKGSRR